MALDIALPYICIIITTKWRNGQTEKLWLTMVEKEYTNWISEYMEVVKNAEINTKMELEVNNQRM